MIDWLLLVEYTREAVTQEGQAYICYRVIIAISEMNYFIKIILLKFYWI